MIFNLDIYFGLINLTVYQKEFEVFYSYTKIIHMCSRTVSKVTSCHERAILPHSLCPAFCEKEVCGLEGCNSACQPAACADE